MVKTQTTGEQAWHTYLTVLLRAKEKTKLRLPETLFCGWVSSKPTILYTEESGNLRRNKDASSGLILTFLSFCPKEHFFPVCVGRQSSTFAVMDMKAAMAIWHKSLASRKPIFLQRYVGQKGQHSSLVRITWKSESLGFVTLVNVIPYSGFIKRRSIVTLGKLSATLEDRFFTRPDQASSSSSLSNREELEVMVESLVGLYKRIVPDQLSELVAEFAQDRQERWYLLRVPSYEVSRTLQVMPTLGQLRLKRSPWLKLDPREYKHLSIKRISQTILSIKQSLGLTITTGDRRRLASYTDFTKKLKQWSLPQLKTKKEEKKFLPLLDFTPTSSDKLPPLFSFPTPHEDELNKSVPTVPGLEDIKDFIKQQNNSMYMRIHYQEELSEDRKLRESAQESVSVVAEEFDRLRERGQEGRDFLRTHQGSLYSSFT